jgi:hypothetical protein
MEVRPSRRMRTLVTRLAPRGLSANELAGALISMMARSKALQSKAGYIDARPPTAKLVEIFLLRTAGPYIRVRSGKARTEQIESAYPSTADIEVMSSARRLRAISDIDRG